MASPNQVKRYLAYWFQLGKKLVINGGRDTLLPQPVIEGNHYSVNFEDCWQQIMQAGYQDGHLEGTTQTIGELLTSKWEIQPCARCAMPVPMLSLGSQFPSCPCSDLPLWPNTELPPPRSPVDSQERLLTIRDRLRNPTGNSPAADSASTSGSSSRSRPGDTTSPLH